VPGTAAAAGMAWQWGAGIGLRRDQGQRRSDRVHSDTVARDGKKWIWGGTEFLADPHRQIPLGNDDRATFAVSSGTSGQGRGCIDMTAPYLRPDEGKRRSHEDHEPAAQDPPWKRRGV